MNPTPSWSFIFRCIILTQFSALGTTSILVAEYLTTYYFLIFLNTWGITHKMLFLDVIIDNNSFHSLIASVFCNKSFGRV